MRCSGLKLAALCVSVLVARSAFAADPQWIEVRSPHFIVASDSGERSARTILEQCEQIRSAIHAVWPWASIDLDKPVVVLAVRNESDMKLLAPQYWERSNSIHPGSIFANGLDRYYIALRTDVTLNDREGTVNPYNGAYWSYAYLAMTTRIKRDLPLWFSYGVAAVMSNTIVTGSSVQVGRILPSHFQRIRSGARPTLPVLLSIDRTSPWFANGDQRPMFDAISWAFVHYLMFGDEGAHSAQLSKYVELLLEGKSASEAATALGNIDSLTSGFATYVARPLWPYTRMNVDSAMKAETISMRPLSGVESESLRAAFLVVSGRLNEARAMIDALKMAGTRLPAVYDTEGMLAESERKSAEARAAYGQAIELGSSNFYTYYRSGVLSRASAADGPARSKVRDSFARAVALNDAFAPARAALAESQLQLGLRDEALASVERAVSLEPRQVAIRLSLIRVLVGLGKRDDAQREAIAAMSLATTDAERRAVQQVAPRVTAAPAAQAATEVAAPGAGLPTPPTSTATTTSNTILTNQDVVAMVAAGIFTDVILAKMLASKCRFDTSTEALAQLKTAHVPDSIVLEMIKARSENLPASETVAAGNANGNSVYSPGKDVTQPVVLRQVNPKYTSEALKARVEGNVFLECVVKQDGTVGEAKVLRSLDSQFGLDLEAIKAAKQWRFRPGTRQGAPVSVRVIIQLTFSLK